ncbi:MAG: hypothetical protein QF844_11750, partial [Acidimicrobiales bacterium]|nr:hypothetical protein [Acidimicrobiales bacterium]
MASTYLTAMQALREAAEKEETGCAGLWSNLGWLPRGYLEVIECACGAAEERSEKFGDRKPLEF